MAVAYPIFPDIAPGRSALVPTAAAGRRINMGGMGWNVKQKANWNNNRQQSVNGRVVVTQYWQNPLWDFEFVYGMDSGFLNDNPNDISATITPSNAPYTDLDLLKGFYVAMSGGAQIFAYQPYDSIVTNQALAAPDSNLNVELVHQIGGYPSAGVMVQQNESVQVIDSATLVVLANGTPTTAFTLMPADTIANYQGIVLQFASSPSLPLTASFNYYYACRYSEDTQEYDNFAAMLWACSSVKIEQVRL